MWSGTVAARSFSVRSENTPNRIWTVKVKRADLAGQLGWGSVGTLLQQWPRLPGSVRWTWPLHCAQSERPCSLSRSEELLSAWVLPG